MSDAKRGTESAKPPFVANRDGNTLARARQPAGFAPSGPGERHWSGH